VKRISEIEALQNEMGLVEPEFKERDLNEERENKIKRANRVIELAKNTYGIKPEEIGREKYQTFDVDRISK